MIYGAYYVTVRTSLRWLWLHFNIFTIIKNASIDKNKIFTITIKKKKVCDRKLLLDVVQLFPFWQISVFERLPIQIVRVAYRQYDIFNEQSKPYVLAGRTKDILSTTDVNHKVS